MKSSLVLPRSQILVSNDISRVLNPFPQHNNVTRAHHGTEGGYADKSIRSLVEENRIKTRIASARSGYLFDMGNERPCVCESRRIRPPASVITLNPAIRDRVKSGHREWQKT